MKMDILIQGNMGTAEGFIVAVCMFLHNWLLYGVKFYIYILLITAMFEIDLFFIYSSNLYTSVFIQNLSPAHS